MYAMDSMPVEPFESKTFSDFLAYHRIASEAKYLDGRLHVSTEDGVEFDLLFANLSDYVLVLWRGEDGQSKIEEALVERNCIFSKSECHFGAYEAENVNDAVLGFIQENLSDDVVFLYEVKGGKYSHIYDSRFPNHVSNGS
jgi:hypothetical protein